MYAQIQSATNVFIKLDRYSPWQTEYTNQMTGLAGLLSQPTDPRILYSVTNRVYHTSYAMGNNSDTGWYTAIGRPFGRQGDLREECDSIYVLSLAGEIKPCTWS